MYRPRGLIHIIKTATNNEIKAKPRVF